MPYDLDRFKDSEFECPCCGLNNMDQLFVSKLDYAAKCQGKGHVWKINSGHRCPKHNAEVGGSDTSTHLRGLAVDIQCRDAKDRYDKVMFLNKAGVKRVVIYTDKMIVHADDDPVKPEGLFPYKRS